MRTLVVQFEDESTVINERFSPNCLTAKMTLSMNSPSLDNLAKVRTQVSFCTLERYRVVWTSLKQISEINKVSNLRREYAVKLRVHREIR